MLCPSFSGLSAITTDSVTFCPQDVDSGEDISDDSAEAGPSTSKRKQSASRPSSSKKTKPAATRDWREVDLTNRQKERFSSDLIPLDASVLPTEPHDIFEMFLDDDLIQDIVDFSQKYARSKGDHSFFTRPEEIRTFLAVLLVSGYSPLPRRKMYWSQDEDVRNIAVTSAIGRDRFDELMKYLHLCDNATIDKEDKMAKVRPLTNALNEKCLLYFPFVRTSDLSIDESMVPYYGRHGAKQFIRGKPIRFGFKLWVLATPLGYCLQFEPYQGARGRQTEYPGLGMGGSVVIDLIAEMQEDQSFHLTFDNLFTSLQLVDCLTTKNIACTGTIRVNRLQDCPLKSINEMKKTKRGSYDYATDVKSGLLVVRWNDNSIVNLVSNKVGVHPIQTARRWSRAEKKKVDVPQPFLIRHYNRTMGGVDRMDQNIEKYRVGIRSKKWWWSIFIYCIDLSVQQAWHLYRQTETSAEKSLDLLAFRRAVAKVYLDRARSAPDAPRLHPGRGRPVALDKRVPAAVRYDRTDHLITPWPTQLRCSHCGLKTKHRCMKCQTGVHDRCFKDFHTQ